MCYSFNEAFLFIISGQLIHSDIFDPDNSHKNINLSFNWFAQTETLTDCMER